MARQPLSLPFSACRLREARERKGLLIKELAKLAGINHSAIGRFENGQRVPTAPNLGKLADALDLVIDDLLEPTQAVTG